MCNFEQSKITLIIQKAVSTQQLRQLELQKTAELSESPLINGRGERMQELQKRIRKVAATPSTIIIFGESGTGKEIIAEEIHKYSPRSAQALLKVNCFALSGEFLEQELFGNAQRLGRFQQAQGGTLFIDDISEMSAEVQFRLFEFLENPVYFEKKFMEEIRTEGERNEKTLPMIGEMVCKRMSHLK
jgi:DNA-binding NtrC family response regulator